MGSVLTISRLLCLSFLLHYLYCCIFSICPNNFVIRVSFNFHSYSPVVRRFENCKSHLFICLLFLFVLWLGLFPLVWNLFILFLLPFWFLFFFTFGLFSSFFFSFCYLFNTFSFIFWLDFQTLAVLLDSFNDRPNSQDYWLNQMMHSSQEEDREVNNTGIC